MINLFSFHYFLLFIGAQVQRSPKYAPVIASYDVFYLDHATNIVDDLLVSR